MSDETFALAGLVPQTIYTPHDATELAQILAECNREKRAAIPWGGGTLQNLGNAPARYAAVIQTTNLNQVVEYAFDDLTVTVQAGMTLAQIERVLNEHGQFLPLDVPHPERATIGGVLAAGANGPLRLRYGPARDYMLGNRFATVEGQIIKAGAKVVKNVAGYELHKVQVGALGTLGMLVEATFKIFPKPPVETSVWMTFDDLAAACAAVPKIWKLPIPPLAVELLDSVTARLVERDAAGTWHAAVRFGGARATMEAARDLCRQLADAQGARLMDARDDAPSVWRALADLPATLREVAPNALLARASVPPKELASALRILSERANANQLTQPRVFAHACAATIYASFDGEPAALEKLVLELRSEFHKLHGHLLVEYAPLSVKQRVGAWDDVGASLKLMQSLKRQFDPNNILNPGRFVGGI